MCAKIRTVQEWFRSRSRKPVRFEQGPDHVQNGSRTGLEPVRNGSGTVLSWTDRERDPPLWAAMTKVLELE